jgi:hypothetical protein
VVAASLGEERSEIKSDNLKAHQTNEFLSCIIHLSDAAVIIDNVTKDLFGGLVIHL